MDSRGNHLLNIVYGLLNYYKGKVIDEKKDISARESLYTIGKVIESDFVILNRINAIDEDDYELSPVENFCFNTSEHSNAKRDISLENFRLPFLRSYSYYERDIPRQLKEFDINLLLVSNKLKIHEIDAKNKKFKLPKKSYCVLFGWTKKLSNKKKRDIDEKFSIALIDFVSQVTELIINMNIFDEMRRDLAIINLEESERKYANLFENSFDVVYLTNRDGVIIDANDKALKFFGIRRHDLRKLELVEFLPDIKNWQEILDQSDEFGLIRDLEVRIKQRNNEEMTCLFTFSSIKTKGDKLLGYHGIIRDTTLQKQIKSGLEKRIVDQQDIYLKTIEIISKTYEMKVPFKVGHHRRVTDFACAMAKEIKLPDESMYAIKIAGTIHDIGEAYLPSGITAKPSELLDYEYDLVKMHPTIGFEVVKEVNFPTMVCNIIKQHHERIDGSGYPEGLKDDNILKESRILAIADVFDALLSARPYRLGYSVQKAKDEIKNMKNLFYDDSLSEAFDRIVRNKAVEFLQ